MARTVGRASIVFPVVAIFAALVLFGCGRIKETPNQLLGTWKTQCVNDGGFIGSVSSC